MPSLFDQIDAASSESKPKEADLFSQIDSASKESPSASVFDQIDAAVPAKPTSSVVADTTQRLGENLWRGLGGMLSGLNRLDERSGKQIDGGLPLALYRKLNEAGYLRGEDIASVADTGTRRTDPARDAGLPALGADIVGGAAPAFLLGPLAPLGMGAMTSSQEKQKALAEGASLEEANARGDLGFSVGTAVGMIPVPGNRILTKVLTGAAGGGAGYAALEKAQGRELDATELAKQSAIGGLFGAGIGVHQKVTMPKLAPVKKGPSIVSQMDGDTHGTPSAANLAANEIAMKPVEATTPPNASAESTSTMDVTVGGRKLNQSEIDALVPSGSPSKPVKMPDYTPVDIGPRDSSVSTGEGVETTKESKMMSDWRKAWDEQNAAAAAEAVVPGKTIFQPEKMGAKEYFDWARENKVGPTEISYTEGIAAIGDDKAIQKLKDARDFTDAQIKSAISDKRLDEAATLTTKRQLYNEAVMAAEHTGSAVGDPRVEAAHKAFNEQKTTQEILTGDNFEKQWKAGGELAGSENQIVIKDGRVYKRNYNEGLDKVYPNHETKAAFDEHLALHNEIFPETALKFEGMSKTKGGEAPVVSQAEIKGVEATPKEVEDFMAAKGFEKYSGSAYVNKEAGLRVGDLKGDNVIKDANGVLHVIDPVIKRIKPEPAKAAPNLTAEARVRAADARVVEPAKPVTDVVGHVLLLSPEDYKTWTRKVKGGPTGESRRVGLAAIGDEAAIKRLKDARESNQKAYKEALKKADSATDNTVEAAEEAAQMLGSKDQFFEEAIQTAENTLSAAKDPEVAAAHAAYAEKQAYLDELLATGEITKAEHAQQSGKAVPAETLPVAEAPVEFTLPKELAKSSPNYSYGEKKFKVSFESDLDKALYIIAQDAKRSVRDADFLDLVMEHTGMTEAEARAAGQEIRDQLKSMAKNGRDGETLTIKSTQDALPKQSPASVPVPPQTEAGQGVGGEVRGRGQESAGTREEAQNPKDSQIVNETSAKEQQPNDLKPLVSPEELQVLADELEVSQIVEDSYDGGTIPPPGEPPPIPPGQPPALPSGSGGSSRGGQPYRQGLTKWGLGMGKAAEAFKILAGTIEGNIRDASKKVFGVLRNYEYAKSQLSLQFEKATMPASRLTRKLFTPKGNDFIGNLLMSGRIDEAKAIVARDTRYGAEFSHAIDAVRTALDYAHQITSEARDGAVTYLKDYFPRQMISYAEFRKFLGRDEMSIADQAIKRAQDASKTPLTQEQVEGVINDLVSQSRRGGGKPGFLKPRTISEIDANISKFYEPWDVALENYLRKVTNDVVNRSYFGKAADGSAWIPSGGSFGKIITDEMSSGRLSGKASDIVIDNLQDRFKMEHNQQGVLADWGRKIRFATSAAYLGQLSTAVAQFGDVFGSILHQGPVDTARAYSAQARNSLSKLSEKIGLPSFKTERNFDLRDIGIHEGNVETAEFSRRKGLVDKAANLTIKFGVGLSDQFNKGGVANAIARHYADVVSRPNTDAFAHLNRDYSAKFPDQWPKILKELQSKAFARGDIKDLPNAQFFLYNEMADIHPINPSGMSQGFNAAHPLAKPIWGLKSYMIKQLDIMRARGYEKVKTPGQRGEGLAYLAAYAAVVGAGQNFAVSWIRDKIANRETDTSDYFIGGFLQPLGLSRYTITQMKHGEYGKALSETALPILSLLREGGNDASLVRDMLISRRDRKTGERTVKDIGDLVSKSELVKHFPVVGSLYYSRAGKGAANEQRRRDEKARGRGQPNTFDTLRSIAVPDETAAR